MRSASEIIEEITFSYQVIKLFYHQEGCFESVTLCLFICVCVSVWKMCVPLCLCMKDACAFLFMYERCKYICVYVWKMCVHLCIWKEEVEWREDTVGIWREVVEKQLAQIFHKNHLLGPPAIQNLSERSAVILWMETVFLLPRQPDLNIIQKCINYNIIWPTGQAYS